MRLHRIWIAIAALAGIPVAGMGLLLAVPATMDGSPAALLLLFPTFLVGWASSLFFRLIRDTRALSLRRNLFAFYIVTGTASVWATTWDFSRDGVQGQMFSPWTMLATAAFFLVPVMHLLFVQPGNEPGATPNGSPAECPGNSKAAGEPPLVR